MGKLSGFCWKEFSKETKETPQGRFRCSRVGFVFIESGESKPAGACSVPRLLPGAQESLDERCRQAARGGGLLGRFSKALTDRFESVMFHCHCATLHLSVMACGTPRFYANRQRIGASRACTASNAPTITMPETTPVIEVATDIITSPAPFQLLRIPYLEVWVGPLRRATCLFALPQDEITLRSALGVRLPHIVKMRSIVCDTIRLCVWC